jgi:hypothetical protein
MEVFFCTVNDDSSGHDGGCLEQGRLAIFFQPYLEGALQCCRYGFARYFAKKSADSAKETLHETEMKGTKSKVDPPSSHPFLIWVLKAERNPVAGALFSSSPGATNECRAPET